MYITKRLHNFLVTYLCPRMARQQPLEEEGNAQQDAPFRDHFSPIVRACRFVAAVAVGEECTQWSVIG